MRKFLILLLSLASLLASAQGRTFGIFSGVSNYEGDYMDLTTSTDDCKRVAAAYKKLGAYTKLLTGKYATSTNILQTIDGLKQLVKEDDQVVYFFSGHGARGQLVTYDDEVRLNYPDLLEHLAALPCRHVVIYLDACFSGSIYAEMQADSTQAVNPIFADHTASNDKFIIYSGSRNVETSRESAWVRGGFFTNALLNALDGKADANQDGQVTAIELFTFIHKNVQDIAAMHKVYNQHPTLTIKDENYDAVLFRLKN